MILLYDVFSREEKGENKKIPQKATGTANSSN